MDDRAQTPLRCFRRRHPPWKVIPLPIGIGDNDNRFAAMRPVFQRRCPGTSERMKTVIDRDRLIHLVGFVCGSTQRRVMRIYSVTPSRRRRHASPEVSETISANGSRSPSRFDSSAEVEHRILRMPTLSRRALQPRRAKPQFKLALDVQGHRRCEDRRTAARGSLRGVVPHHQRRQITDRAPVPLLIDARLEGMKHARVYYSPISTNLVQFTSNEKRPLYKRASIQLFEANTKD